MKDKIEKEELISIIMPTYNSEGYVLKTVQSVINQSYQNWELIITDDASTDNTVALLKNTFVREDRIKIYTNEINQGAAITRNNSIKKAQGRYIAFLDSDDFWFPKKLEIQLNFMKNNNCDLSYSSFIVVDEKGKQKGYVEADKQVTYKSLLKQNTVGFSTMMYDTKKIGKVYMPLIRKRQDWALLLKIMKQENVMALGIKTPLTQYTLRKGSISSNKIRIIKHTWLVFYKIENMSKIKSTYHFILFLYFYFLKIIRNRVFFHRV